MSKPVGDRACLAGVGQSFNRPMDMLIFFGERRAGASGDFANALERQAIRVIMDAQLCGPVTPGGDDVRVLNALPPSQLSGKSGYAAISLIRSEEHTSELQSLMRTSYAVFCLKNKKTQYNDITKNHTQYSDKHCRAITLLQFNFDQPFNIYRHIGH